MARPGSESTIVTRKKRKPAANAWSDGHAEVPEEADEEGLAHREPVQRERHQQHEEEERPHHVEDADGEVDADRLRGRPDREHAHRLDRERQREDADEQPGVSRYEWIAS